MADPETRWPDNSPGRFYVDENCIDCDLCRTTAPRNFSRSEEGGYSFVSSQPDDPRQAADCQQAQADCPVDAIGDEAEDAA